ncbi:molybdopterin-dependent oxidoreductase Mo/Fe-S-binding subunit [candidate division KSB3 bacterium]|uniref:Molybdopterin-dependent oxidoreductase Mo/Fe-S-binding subunit n=1 Tax=candidate division KSB3 bacterium TaxID=2044937 RepID=A0A2G6EBF4_9BACT|nr:MAG: molybdopterin-dependent oxidoreductase Mo/Fe-S-binding subunit [candidate division KSB3 bacterium]PIE30727.1 MAG: molybdopterin-dependent oxidoreductase Mo/Fe-S-binding subunit [candidate division KSB3 bacterium]
MKIAFTLNGTPHTINVSAGQKVLGILKELRIRSVRRGCDEEGKCGNCSIILDGQLVNSCMLIPSQIDGKNITTIEGLSKGRELHKIQQAFIDAGLVQCGYCTPAQMLAAKALLDVVPNPTREQIQDAFSGVLCRCTGYRQIYNAIDMVTQGKRAEDFTPEYKQDYRVVGKLTPKIDAEQLVRAEESFVEDYVAPDALHLYILRSPHPHAEIVSIDSRDAERLPGVEYVLTHENSPKTWYTQAGQTFPEPSPYDQQVIGSKMRFIGDRVAAVAATSYELARYAAEKIRVEYAVLPAVFSIEDTVKEDAPVIHDRDLSLDPIDIGGDPQHNIVARNSGGIGDVEQGFKEAAAVIERSFYAPHIQHTPMEPHTAYAYMKNGRLIVHSSVQTPYHVRRILSNILEIDENNIRVIKEKVGGGFGAKQDCSVEDVVAVIAYRTGKPVYLRYSRKEEFIFSRTRRPLYNTVKAGISKDGRLTALKLTTKADSGAYGPHCLTVPMNGCSKTLPMFTCANMAYDVTSYYTNNIVPGAYQGYGVPQANFAIHLTLAELAQQLGLDFEEFIQKNLVYTGYQLDILKQLGEGKEGLAQKISSCGFPECFEKGFARYHGWENAPKSPDEDLRQGKGFAVMMQGSGIPGIDAANAVVRMVGDGTFILQIGGADLGTGEDTVAAKVAAEELGVSQEQVTVLAADTDVCPFDKGSYASSGTFFTGNAAYVAAHKMRKLIVDAAAEILNTAADELQIFPGGKVGTASRQLSYKELAYATQSGSGCGQLIASGAFTTDRAPIPYAAHFAQVSVNRRTGMVTVDKYYAVHDCGVPINPDLAKGQVYGAIMKTIGHSFYEALEFDAHGRCLNANYTGYPIPGIEDLPEEFDVDLVEIHDPITPYVGKSISEIACNGASACIALAINQALGIWLREWPFRPEKVLAALEQR